MVEVDKCKNFDTLFMQFGIEEEQFHASLKAHNVDADPEFQEFKAQVIQKLTGQVFKPPAPQQPAAAPKEEVLLDSLPEQEMGWEIKV